MKNKGEDLNNTRREVESEKREGHVSEEKLLLVVGFKVQV